MINPFGVLFERRSIASPADLLSYFGRGLQSTAGAMVSESSAFGVPVVLTCVGLRSRSLASLPIKVYERKPDGTKQPAPYHDAARLLKKPNGWQTWPELAGLLEAHRVLRGNAYAWRNWGRMPGSDGKLYDAVMSLIPLHPDRMTVEGDPLAGGPRVYRYTTAKGEQILFEPREILHLRGLSTDGLVGRSVLQDMREPIGGAIAQSDHANGLWSNDATPRVILTHPKVLSSQAKDGIERAFADTYGRTGDKKRVAVLEEGMTLSPLSLTPEDGQFLETRKLTRAEIAGAFFVPPHMVGDVDRSTSWGTGIEQQQIGFVVFTMRPDLVVWEQRLTQDLIVQPPNQPDRFFIEFSAEGFMRGDAASRGAFYRIMREVGAYSANDIRALENMNPIDGGNVYLQPVNLAPLGYDPSKTPTQGHA